MLIEYKDYDRNGNKVSGTLEAASEEVAEDILWRSDLIVTKVHKVRKLPGLHTLFPSIFGIKEQSTISMVRQLSTLLDSGLPLLLALQAIGHEKSHPLMKETLRGLIEFLGEGGQFSDGIAKYPGIFRPLFVRLARIGEQTGELSAVLRRGADYLEAQSELKSKLRASMTYPAIVAVMAAISVYILLNFSIPMLSGLIEEFGADLPLTTRLIVGLSNLANTFGLYLLVLLVLGVLGVSGFGQFWVREIGVKKLLV